MSGTRLTCPEMAKDIIASLRADGIEPTLDQIAELIELARRVQEPTRKTSPWYEGAPVRAGESGPILRPLTIQAVEWYDWAVSHFAADETRGMAFCFAAERGHIAGAFDDLWTVAGAKRKLNEYARRLSCTRAELESAAMRVMDESNPGDVLRARNDDGESSADFGDIMAKLEAVTGQPREYWITKPRCYAMRVLRHAIESSSAAGVWGKEADGNDPDYIDACYNLQAAEILIREGAENGR